MTTRPTLAVCILARSSDAGLERLLDEVDGIADQIVIGVDDASTDDTFGIARRRADVVFRFEHTGPPMRARMLVLDHARTDWVLSIDEDEGLDAAFAQVLPELLADSRYSHYWFPRKWLVASRPLTYLHCAPWFPDWKLRLFRNDRRRVWHTGILHSGFQVVGAARHENRTAILHYEPLVLSEEQRRAKIAFYRSHGSGGRFEGTYASLAGSGRRPVEPGAATLAGPRRARANTLIPGVARVPPATPPPWRATLTATMEPQTTAGATALVEVTTRNDGPLAWEPYSAWPPINLSYHLRDSSGEMVQFDGVRYVLPCAVEPGATVRQLIDWRAPTQPGDYIVEWDLVIEGETWFGACGTRTVQTRVRVT